VLFPWQKISCWLAPSASIGIGYKQLLPPHPGWLDPSNCVWMEEFNPLPLDCWISRVVCTSKGSHGRMGRTGRHHIDCGFGVEIFPHLRILRYRQFPGKCTLSVVMSVRRLTSVLRLVLGDIARSLESDKSGGFSMSMQRTETPMHRATCSQQKLGIVIHPLGSSFLVVLRTLTLEPIEEALLSLIRPSV
jgi:hypothetical protein